MLELLDLSTMENIVRIVADARSVPVEVVERERELGSPSHHLTSLVEMAGRPGLGSGDWRYLVGLVPQVTERLGIHPDASGNTNAFLNDIIRSHPRSVMPVILVAPSPGDRVFMSDVRLDRCLLRVELSQGCRVYVNGEGLVDGGSISGNDSYIFAGGREPKIDYDIRGCRLTLRHAPSEYSCFAVRNCVVTTGDSGVSLNVEFPHESYASFHSFSCWEFPTIFFRGSQGREHTVNGLDQLDSATTCVDGEAS